MLVLPNIVAGKEVTSDEQTNLNDCHGSPFACTSCISSSQLRHAKRALAPVEASLHARIRLIIRASELYLQENRQLRELAQLTGSPISYLSTSFQQLRHWMRHCEVFLERVFGQTMYTQMKHHSTEDRHTHLMHSPHEKAVVILPRNEEIVAGFVITQLILAGVPALIRTSSGGASSYCSVELFRALRRAADILGESQIDDMLSHYSVVNYTADNKEETLAGLYVANATYIVFGSNETIQHVQQEINKLGGCQKLVPMGTGLSMAMILDDADIHHAAEQVSHASAMDRGNKCTSTSVCYVHTNVYEPFVLAVKEHASRYVSRNPLEVSTRLGIVDCHARDHIHKYVRQHGLSVKGIGEQLVVGEVEHTTPVQELDGPVLLIKQFDDDKELLQHMKRDLEHNALSVNLTTSVFTSSAKRFEHIAQKLPSHTIRHNIPTTHINLFAPHQGTYLIKELVTSKICEMPVTQHLNTQKHIIAPKEVMYGTGPNKDSRL